MSAPLASKTTISSRLKAAAATNQNNQSNGIAKSNIQPPSHYNNNNNIHDNKSINNNGLNGGFKTPAPPGASSRLASLANGLPKTVARASTASAIAKSTDRLSPGNNLHSTINSKSTSETNQQAQISSAPKTTTTTTTTSKAPIAAVRTIARPSATSRLPPSTNVKASQLDSKVKLVAPSTISRSIGVNRNRPTTSGNLNRPINNARPISNTNAVGALNSRSPSIVSSIDSSLAGSRRTSVASSMATTASRNTSAKIPDTNLVRKGLAKFSNPIECQRQFVLLNQRIQTLTDNAQTQNQEILRLKDQLQKSLKSGVGYAIAVQYLAKKLKIDSDVDLEQECEHLKARISDLEVNEHEYESRLESIVDDYKSHLQIELDLRNSIKQELDETRKIHLQELENLAKAHKNELNDLETKHSSIEQELQSKIDTLESDLRASTKELTDLRKEHEDLVTNYNKLEDSLTKDKDARVKYAQEKVCQLQKDVESLNSVLEMRLERIHALEKDSLQLSETRDELDNSLDANKALKQQIESLNAALEKKREQFETLVADHEILSQELKRERKERRRMTMKTEELEYALNESCANDTASTLPDLNSSVSEKDNNRTENLVDL